jgi:hypothetical protein
VSGAILLCHVGRGHAVDARASPTIDERPRRDQ